MARRLSELRERLGSESGFSLIELVVAATVGVIALLAVISVFDSSRNLITKAEQIEVATHVGEQELERVVSMDYAAVASATLPAHASDEFDPRYYVTTSGTKYQWDPSDSTRVEDFVPATGTLAPCSNWNDGASRLSGETCRFVTSIYDPNLVQTPTDKADAKRVTVAVSVAGNKTKPITLTSIVWDRKAL